MDKVKHEIEAALAWLEEGNVGRAKLHLGFALQWRNEEASQHRVYSDVCPGSSDGKHEFYQGSTWRICAHCGTRR